MYMRTEGVVLRRTNFGEADRIVTFYTRDLGKVTAIAHGVRRPRSKKAGHIELGSWCKIFIARGKSLDLLTEVELKKSFGAADFSEAKINKIYHLLELINKLTVDHQRNNRLFVLLINYLNLIEVEEDFNLVSNIFKIKILSCLGFFSSREFAQYKSGEIIKFFEHQDFNLIKKTVNLSEKSHLKLLRFLDSMIEEVTDQQLKTSRFLNGY